MSKCEWDPENSCFADINTGCRNKAVYRVKRKVHICAECAELPAFSGKRKVKLRLRERKNDRKINQRENIYNSSELW